MSTDMLSKIEKLCSKERREEMESNPQIIALTTAYDYLAEIEGICMSDYKSELVKTYSNDIATQIKAYQLVIEQNKIAFKEKMVGMPNGVLISTGDQMNNFAGDTKSLTDILLDDFEKRTSAGTVKDTDFKSVQTIKDSVKTYFPDIDKKVIEDIKNQTEKCLHKITDYNELHNLLTGITDIQDRYKTKGKYDLISGDIINKKHLTKLEAGIQLYLGDYYSDIKNKMLFIYNEIVKEHKKRIYGSGVLQPITDKGVRDSIRKMGPLEQTYTFKLSSSCSLETLFENDLEAVTDKSDKAMISKLNTFYKGFKNTFDKIAIRDMIKDDYVRIRTIFAKNDASKEGDAKKCSETELVKIIENMKNEIHTVTSKKYINEAKKDLLKLEFERLKIKTGIRSEDDVYSTLLDIAFAYDKSKNENYKEFFNYLKEKEEYNEKLIKLGHYLELVDGKRIKNSLTESIGNVSIDRTILEFVLCDDLLSDYKRFGKNNSSARKKAVEQIVKIFPDNVTQKIKFNNICINMLDSKELEEQSVYRCDVLKKRNEKTAEELRDSAIEIMLTNKGIEHIKSKEAGKHMSELLNEFRNEIKVDGYKGKLEKAFEECAYYPALKVVQLAEVLKFLDVFDRYGTKKRDYKESYENLVGSSEVTDGLSKDSAMINALISDYSSIPPAKKSLVHVNRDLILDSIDYINEKIK